MVAVLGQDDFGELYIGRGSDPPRQGQPYYAWSGGSRQRDRPTASLGGGQACDAMSLEGQPPQDNLHQVADQC